MKSKNNKECPGSYILVNCIYRGMILGLLKKLRLWVKELGKKHRKFKN